ncbi:hypothetical protein F2Q69_00003878 [Brassica cretica]|uniref:Cytochrome P450 n=1 Tax=Brassica cretica TaxID=69181 RepID=A0A8S9NLQ4_BRACR|nr:hypothetical protein F2Q69_00003878 [Brassica cretica]
MVATIIVDFQYCFIFILLCFSSLLCYTLFFRKPKDSCVDFPLPPSPPSLPIIGHLYLLLSVLIHRSLQKLSSKYGSILYLRIFGFPIVLVSSASVAYEIFRAHDVNISSRGFPPTDDSLFAGSFSIISAPYGDYWKFMKKVLVTNLLGPQALERSRRVRGDELDRFYNNLFDKAAKKESVEICEEALKLTISSICKLIMGRCCLEEGGVVERVKGLANELNELLQKVLVEYEEKQGEHHLQGMDLMDVLLEAYRDEKAEYKITRNHIKSFYAWTLAEIINSPNTLKRLRGELDSVVGTVRLIQETDLPNLPYLQAVVKEGLRLHPPGPLFGRFSQEGCKVGGFYVPEKTSLMINDYAVMRDPDYWVDPDEFKPESGRRSCPGENLAFIFIGTAIGVMVQGFEWKFKEDKVNMEETVVGLSLTMAHPLKRTPVARTFNSLTLNLKSCGL